MKKDKILLHQYTYKSKNLNFVYLQKLSDEYYFI